MSPTRTETAANVTMSGDAGGASERGAAMVELALALPILIMLLLGTFTTALALNDDLQLTHAAREGARHGATVPDDQSFASDTWAQNVQAVVLERFGTDLQSSDVCVSLISGSPGVPLSGSHTTNADGSGCYDDSSSGVSDARVQVAVEKDAVIDTGLYSYDLVLSSEAITRHESNG